MQLTMMVSLCWRILWLTWQCTVNTLAVLDALGRYGVFGIVGAQWDTADNTAKSSITGNEFDPPLKGLNAYVQNIKNHPALLGYYLFDVKSLALQSNCLPACSLIVCRLACLVCCH